MDKLATLGQLASGIAHEIKNPLAGISSTLQVISSSLQLEGVKKEMVKEVFNQIKRLDETIRNLLRFAKPGLPKMTLADPREVIENVLFLVSQQLKKQNIEVNLDIHGEPFKVMMDLQLIQQALLNVVLNSVHAMPSGGNLVFSLKERQIPDPSGKESKSHVSLIISDTGTGIPDDVLPQIFNPFYTTKAKGTGLGLSITQRIIEQHNGRIEVKSEMGKGTSFSIDLPA
jgi:two-component system NtrC family sensor kinase